MDLRLQLSCWAFAGLFILEAEEELEDDDWCLAVLVAVVEPGVVEVVQGSHLGGRLCAQPGWDGMSCFTIGGAMELLTTCDWCCGRSCCCL